MQHLRVTFGHVRQCELGYGKHLQDIGPEQRLDLVQINLLEVLAHELLGSIVDQNIDSAESGKLLRSIPR